MTDDWTADAWEDAIRAVFRRALTEPDFRELALKDPRAAFMAATGKPAPDNLKFRFVEALDEHVLVLPKLIGAADGSVSEIDLSRVLYHSVRQQSVPPAFNS